MTRATLERPNELSSLHGAFETFARSAEQLARAYRNLEAKASRVDRELAQTNAALRAILGSVPSGLIARNQDGAVTEVNQAAERLLGLSSHELRTRTEALVDGMGAPLLRAGIPGSIRAEERTVITPDGRHLVLLWTRTPLTPRAGLCGVLEVFTDLTEVRRLQAEVIARERLASLGETAAALTHQVRNPLHGLRGFLGLLRRELDRSPASQTVRHYASQAWRGVELLEDVVDGILDYARLDSPELEPLAVSDLVAGALEATRAARGAAGSISVSIPEGLAVSADPRLLGQVLINLLDNALDATDGAGPVHVRAREAAQGAGVVIEIEDEGTGLQPEIVPRLFLPLSSGKPGGSGMGLAYAHKIILAHGGSLSAANRPQGGARFAFELQRATLTSRAGAKQ